MSKKNQNTQQKSNKRNRQSWTVPNTPPAIRPKPKPFNSPKPSDSPKPQADKPKK